ncbi:hypothetical protein [Microbacterium sp. H1-D42]|uniref:hypothetical protein n=1 Tax=Microbacterium sp. H1-D42 TaxID=2925844 RepID=UPI001F52CE6D|nr:hypothetical protein [Microbacterium sp. H1-D42]UNK72449.1 hypothetical protein MNR00_08465 [Microbacterium sp. H1-D42]
MTTVSTRRWQVDARPAGAAAVVITAALALTGCATPPASDGEPTSAAGATSAGEPVRLTTPFGITVLDDGDGAELCLGAVLESYPPQCSGAKLVDWDWTDWTGAYEEAGDVRWGSFTLTGTYDPEAYTFTVAEATASDPADLPEQNVGAPDAMFATPCAEPDGGWRVLDPARTTDDTMNLAFERAAQLNGYAASWVDRSRVPDPGPDATPQEQLEMTSPFPDLTVINVKLVGDVAAAEAALSQIWGGMLCVTAAERTEAELQSIADELIAEMTPSGAISGVGVDGMAGTVGLQVVYDDGALQKRMDDEYGAGLVVVTSLLTPVD